MPWVKHSDQRWCDPEFARLSDGAQALWFRADSYTASQLLDGFLPEDALRHMRTRKRYIDELVREGWWKRLEAGDPLAGDWRSTGGWLAVGWQERMRCKVDVLATRSEAKQRVSAKRSQEQKPKFAPPDPVPVKIPEEKEEIRERDRAHAREAPEVQGRNPEPVERFIPARRPLGESPPDFTPVVPPRPLKSVIWDEHCRIVLNRDPASAGLPDWKAVEAVERAVLKEAGDSRPDQIVAIRRLLEAWKRDTKSTQQLANLATYLFKYTKPLAHPKPVLKPAPAQRAVEPEVDLVDPTLEFAEMRTFGLQVLEQLHARHGKTVAQ